MKNEKKKKNGEIEWISIINLSGPNENPVDSQIVLTIPVTVLFLDKVLLWYSYRIHFMRLSL